MQRPYRGDRLDHGQVKGSAAEHMATAAFLMNGFKVYHQDHDSGASDLIVDKEGKLLRVQVKSFYIRADPGKSSRSVACICRAGLSKHRKHEDKDIRPFVDLFALVELETGTVITVDAKISPKTAIGLDRAKLIGQIIFPLKS